MASALPSLGNLPRRLRSIGVARHTARRKTVCRRGARSSQTPTSGSRDALNCLDEGELNRRLFQHGAAILEGKDGNMARPRDKDPAYVSPYANWFRFSFGPLRPETFDSDVAILSQVLNEYRADVAGTKPA